MIQREIFIKWNDKKSLKSRKMTFQNSLRVNDFGLTKVGQDIQDIV